MADKEESLEIEKSIVKNFAICAKFSSIGEKLCYEKDLSLTRGIYGSLHRGFWKEKFDSKERKVFVRRMKVTNCAEMWNNITDKYLKGILDHENILKVYGYAEDAHHWRYFALELYVATLEEYCNQQYTDPMPSEVQVLYQIASGIKHLHKKGLAHGNLNPQTILIAQSIPVRVKLAEFGLCKFVDYDHQEKVDAIGLDSVLHLSNRLRQSLGIGRLNNAKNKQISHPQFWMSIGFLPTDADGNQLLPSATVNGDIFAAGCIFFYFLRRGLHPFGDEKSILNNISLKKPVNFNKLQKDHFAFEHIKNMIGDPPTDGRNFLEIAKEEFKQLIHIPLNIGLSNELGRGAFGIVFRGTFECKPVAVKKIPKTLSVFSTEHFREIAARIKFDHENVVKMIAVEEDAGFGYIVLELCAGTLEQFIKGKYQGPPLPSDATVLYDIANGLNYIHSQNLVHRDIKPKNILISLKHPVVMKVADLGLAKPANSREEFSISEIKSTLNWIAPECFITPRESEYNESKRQKTELRGSVKSDIFSAGLVFFYFLTRGVHPFGDDRFKTTKNIEENNPANLTRLPKDHFAYSLIKNMIKRVEERIDMDKVMETLGPLAARFKLVLGSTPQISHYRRCRFHPTDAVVACCSDDGKVVIFKAVNRSAPFSEWKMEREFLGKNSKHITALEWNVNGSQLAAGYSEGSIINWSFPSGQILFQVKAHNRVETIKWNPFTQGVFVTRHWYEWKKLFLWESVMNGDAMTENQFRTLEYDVNICSSEWISTNEIAFGLENDLIVILSINEEGESTSHRIGKQFKLENALMKLEWNEATKYLSSSSSDGWIKIWSMDKSTDNEPVHSLKVDSVCFNLAWRPIKKIDEGEINAKRKSKENLSIACGLENGSIVIWNPLGEVQILPQKHSNCIQSLLFSSNGQFLASTDFNGEIIIWFVANSQIWTPVFTCSACGYLLNDLSWMEIESSNNPSSYKLALNSYNKDIRIIESLQVVENNKLEMEKLEKIEDMLLEDYDSKNWKGHKGQEQERSYSLGVLINNVKGTDQYDAIERIISRNGFDVKRQDRLGRTPLHFLCENGSLENLTGVIQLLIGKGIDINCKDNEDENALDYFYRNANINHSKDLAEKTVGCLFRYGIQVNNRKVQKYYKIWDERNEIEILLRDFAMESKTLGWHQDCQSCNALLTMNKTQRYEEQRRQKFTSTYMAFKMIWDDLEKWAKSTKTSETIQSLEEWLLKQSEGIKSEIFCSLAKVYEQVKMAGNSSKFNCDEYENYMRVIRRVADCIGAKETKKQIDWFYLLPFDFPFLESHGDSEEIQQIKKDWDQTLFEWSHAKIRVCGDLVSLP